jgi:hypothetical protein
LPLFAPVRRCLLCAVTVVCSRAPLPAPARCCLGRARPAALACVHRCLLRAPVLPPAPPLAGEEATWSPFNIWSSTFQHLFSQFQHFVCTISTFNRQMLNLFNKNSELIVPKC